MQPTTTASAGLSDDTVAVVLAGGKGTRLGALTRHVCKPALPFGAAYRNIDFSLANCVNSGIGRIGVATQHKSDTLLRHLEDVWRGVMRGPDRFVAAWRAEERAPDCGYLGTANAVFRNLETIEGLDSRFVLVLAGDHVYRMDYRPMLAYHVAHRADVTVGCIDVEREQAHQFGVLSIDAHGRIERFVEKPRTLAQSQGDRVPASMGIYVFDRGFLADVLRRDADLGAPRHDFGADVLPRLVGTARIFAFPFRDGGRPAYWRDIGTPKAYWQAHLDLLDASSSLRLDDPAWPLPAARGAPKRSVARGDTNGPPGSQNSLIADDCVVSGTVRRSVLFGGVRVHPGAVVESSVVLPDAVIGRNSRLHGVIVDSGCVVPPGTVFGRAAAGEGPVLVTADDFLPPLGSRLEPAAIVRVNRMPSFDSTSVSTPSKGESLCPM